MYGCIAVACTAPHPTTGPPLSRTTSRPQPSGEKQGPNCRASYAGLNVSSISVQCMHAARPPTCAAVCLSCVCTQHVIGVKPQTLTHIRSMNSDNTASELEGSILDNRRLLDDSCALLDEVRRSRIPGPLCTCLLTLFTHMLTLFTFVAGELCAPFANPSARSSFGACALHHPLPPLPL